MGVNQEKGLGGSLKAIILAAGVGSRMGRILPKCLIMLPSGKTILKNQIDILKKHGIQEIIVVVGFKKEIIIEKYPELLYKYNPLYHLTNTSKSLLAGLENIDPDDLLWLNGDVFLENQVLHRMLSAPKNAVAVNKIRCGVEEVKYQTNSEGKVIAISKRLEKAEGEAVGVNKISKESFCDFLEALQVCEDNDYFEKAMEICIEQGIEFYPVNMSDCKCVEIDFMKDFETVKRFFNK